MNAPFSLPDQLGQLPHRRFNPLRGEWVLVSPHRTQRPWQGKVEDLPAESQVAYDPQCYLCPGNQRAGGHRNPPYTSTFVFQNDFSALLPEVESIALAEHSLLRAQTERGLCQVVCFSPKHHLTVARMSVPELRTVVDTWAGQYRDLGALPYINHVQIFENRGAMMGASNPHPHCQIWADERLPNEPLRELQNLHAYTQDRGACMLCEYVELERHAGQRLVCENEHFTALVPFWAVWPFETLLLARRHVASFADVTDPERQSLADIMKRLTTRYDNLFGVSFPYTMGFHQAPTDGDSHPEWHLHAHYYPPLLRSATVQKFMVGYEMLCMPQRDVTPESAAARLREMPEIHER